MAAKKKKTSKPVNQKEDPKIPRYFAVIDDKGEELIRHEFNALFILATPSEPEAKRLQDKDGNVPLISYQFGLPPALIALIRIIPGVLPQIHDKWVKRFPQFAGGDTEPKQDSGLVGIDGKPIKNNGQKN